MAAQAAGKEAYYVKRNTEYFNSGTAEGTC